MNAAVDASAKPAVSTGFCLANEVPRPDQKDVVVAVEKRKLLILFSEDHEKSVQKLNVLIIIVDPDQERDSEAIGARLRSVSPHGCKPGVVVDFADHGVHAPHIQQALVHIVGENERLDLKFLSVLHELGAEIDSEQIDDSEKSWGRKPDLFERINVGHIFLFLVEGPR